MTDPTILQMLLDEARLERSLIVVRAKKLAAELAAARATIAEAQATIRTLTADLATARAEIAGQAAEIERLRAVVELTDAHVRTVETHGALRWAGIPALRAALDATSTREDQP